jgi:hypothetical protein
MRTAAMTTFLPIDELPDPPSLVAEATALLTGAGDVLVAVVDLEAVAGARSASEASAEIAKWVRAVHGAAREARLAADSVPAIVPPIVVVGQVVPTADAVQALTEAGAVYLPKPRGWDDIDDRDYRATLLRFLDPSPRYEAWLNENQRRPAETEEDRGPMAGEGERDEGDQRGDALQIFTDPALGLPAADFARLFAVARGYDDPTEDREAREPREE